MSDQEASKKRPLDDGAREQDATPSASEDTLGNHPSKKARPHESNSGVAETSNISGNTPAIAQPQVQRQQQRPPHQQQKPPSRKDFAFFGTEVPDDVVRTIAEFLFEHCHHANVEIEAKLGILMDKNTRKRIELPVRSEVVLAPQGRPTWYQFSSDMTLQQHAHFNNTLNRRLEQTRAEPRERQIRYQHTKEIDEFYQTPLGKTRVTRDQTTKEVIPHGIVKKDRIADLDIYSPRSPFDFRVSVNIEVPVPLPEGTVQYKRHKDRISYRHNNFKIDLTQVKSDNAPGGSSNPAPQAHNYSQMRPTNMPMNNSLDVTHELEIEFDDPQELVREREIRINSGGRQPDRFIDIVGHFVNNIRGLAVRGNIQQQQQQQQPQLQQQQRLQQQRP